MKNANYIKLILCKMPSMALCTSGMEIIKVKVRSYMHVGELTTTEMWLTDVSGVSDFQNSRSSRKQIPLRSRKSVCNWSWLLMGMCKYRVFMSWSSNRVLSRRPYVRAVRLRECPLRELQLYPIMTISIIHIKMLV